MEHEYTDITDIGLLRKNIFSSFVAFLVFIFHPFILIESTLEKRWIMVAFFLFTFIGFIVLRIGIKKGWQYKYLARSYSVLAILMFLANYWDRGGFFKVSVAWYPVMGMMVIVLLDNAKERLQFLGITVLSILFLEMLLQAELLPVNPISDKVRIKNLITSAILSFSLVAYTFHKFLYHLEYFAQKFLENFEMKEVLLSVLYHDISTPLTSIMISATSDSKAASTRIQLAANGIRDIIDNVRTLQRLSLGKMDPNIEEVSLNQCIETAINRLSLAAETKKIELNYHNAPEDYLICVNPTLFMTSVLNNILHNAIKFSEEGGKIDIYVRKTKNQIYMTIQDYGIGIPPEIREKVFQLRSKVSRKGTKLETGSGFGLPIAQKLLQLWDAKIFLPAADKGTTVVLYLRGKINESN